MLQIGQYNELEVVRLTDFGAFLRPAPEADDDANSDGDNRKASDEEVLMPGKFFPDGPESMTPGTRVRAFVYTDTHDRPIATTERPFATVGEAVFLQVADVNPTGAFLDWGLEAKQLLVPYSEQIVRMRTGMQYLVYVTLDELTGRVIATARLDRCLSHDRPPYKMGDEVDALVVEHVERLGWKVVVDNKYRGMIYSTSLFEPLVIGSRIRACVKYVRDDNKIDLTPGARIEHRLASLADRLESMLRDHPDHTLHITDRSTPEEVKALLGCSKKDFKRALGKLFKERKVAIEVDRIILARP